MRILIDARMMTAQATRGIGRYIEELLRAMLVVEPEHRYCLLTRSADHPFVHHPSVETIVTRVPWYGVSEQFVLPRLLWKYSADVVHIPHWNVPLICPGPLVITIHDLLLRHEPLSAHISTRHWSVALVKRLGYRLTVSMAIRHAEKIFVPTQFVAKDVAAFYPDGAQKILVTGEGFGGAHASAISIGSHGETGQSPYLLYVGSAYPHKGLDDLLGAWKEIEARYPTLRLKIVGENDVFMQRLQRSADQQGLSHVDWMGYVADAKLTSLYAQALAFIFPSRFEGFGLPPLEALAAGCPVIAARAGSIPEVLGQDGALFFEAGSRAGILGAIEALLRNPDDARRNAARVLPELQRRHDWMSAARKTLEAYHSIARHGRSPRSRLFA